MALRPAAKLSMHSVPGSTVNPSGRHRCHRRKRCPPRITRLVARPKQMHNDLPALAAKIGERLSMSSEYVVTQPAELRVLREMSDEEVRVCVMKHGGCIIRRILG